ncbi:ORF092 [Staphylococcus phage 55]|uniref:ORF092 n=3 Tax=Azeredovirinae TaxID=2842522 RepID=Q4ZB95_9CAUD|nr:ORF092 [Staphylococcus phage 55]AAX90897.1 ORF098 [Staphylococcus phage 53]AAX90979.1 ORF102 [Staphylococcus phage 85]AAX91710.1 ORF092 [Staphylococcus phage 55]
MNIEPSSINKCNLGVKPCAFRSIRPCLSLIPILIDAVFSSSV